MSGNLLLVDDEPMTLDALARHFRRHHFQVSVASCGREALEMLSTPQFDLVLMDVVMPGMDGIEVLRRLREKHSETELPVVMLSARDESDDIVRCLEQGANDYVTKPVDVAVLLARVRTQVRMRRSVQLKEDFVAIASHDLKGPLTSIRLATQTIQEELHPGVPMTEDAWNLLGQVASRASAMTRIVEDFLEFRVLKDGEVELRLTEVDVAEIAASMINSNAPYARTKQIEIASSLEASTVMADETRLAQAVDNLINNAIKFSPPRSTVTVRVVCVPDGVDVSVHDAGPGIHPADVDRLFLRWVRLHHRPSGGESSSGLGLAISKAIIDLHGGQIGARDNVGPPAPEGDGHETSTGATFWFRIPFEPPTWLLQRQRRESSPG